MTKRMGAERMADEKRRIGLAEVVSPLVVSASAAIIGGFAEKWPFDTATFVPTMFYAASVFLLLVAAGGAILMFRDRSAARRS